MKTRYTIKNFRVFDEKGATIDVNPITILTGCNSSGKSSIVKSMVLLNTYIDSIQKDYNVFKEIDLKKHKLDFTKDTTISLGNFNRVRNKDSKENAISFMYQVHSLLLGEDIKVCQCMFVSVGEEGEDTVRNMIAIESGLISIPDESEESTQGRLRSRAARAGL